MAAADRRARALKLWEQVAFPYRRRGAVVYRIFAPRDIFGSPIVDAMSLDEFIWHISFKLTERLNR